MGYKSLTMSSVFINNSLYGMFFDHIICCIVWYVLLLLNYYLVSFPLLPPLFILRYHKSPRLRLLKLENVQIAFDCMKREGLQLLNIGEWVSQWLNEWVSDVVITLCVHMTLLIRLSFIMHNIPPNVTQHWYSGSNYRVEIYVVFT